MAPSNNSSRSSYSNKFKLMAVGMADELGCFAEAARRLGIDGTNIRRWKQQEASISEADTITSFQRYVIRQRLRAQ